MYLYRLWQFLLVTTVLLLVPSAQAQAHTAIQPIRQTEPDYSLEAQSLLARMTPAERVGQLFLVTFEGIDTSPNSDIYDLIVNYHVGGVMLKAENNNITGNTIDNNSVPQQVVRLNNNLQQLALTGRLATTAADDAADDASVVTPEPTPVPGVAIPLFIGATQEGDDISAVRGGLTQIPSQMAIGATWQPIQAEAIGRIVGRELHTVGINMLFGPALDILNGSSPGGQISGIGTQVFGGNPYWVSKMGVAYINGVKSGSENHLAVIPTHFPGIGSSDRVGYDEIATVRRSFAELATQDLLPFKTAVSAPHPADGLLTAHIRYQGLQGNILPSTAPLSFDPQAIETLLQIDALNQWRATGGILVSDALGVAAIERFYDSTLQEFPHRQVAKDALLAGNDLLYLAEFASGEATFAEQSDAMRDTLVWFREKYETDPSFQQRVDQAVLRLLQLKLELYEGNFVSENVLRNEGGLNDQLRQDESVIFNLAQEAVTLLAPTAAELIDRLPGPPTLNDNIVLFTDVRQTRQCTTCPSEALIDKTALEQRMLALYGPEASGQIQPEQLTSFSLADLQEFLNAPNPLPPLATPEPETTPSPDPDFVPSEEPTLTPTPSQPFLVQQALLNADWLIFSIIDVQEGTASAALKEIMAQRPDLLRNKRVIVFAFGSPIYLDTTEISKLSAYFGVYSTSEEFIDAAVRALFRDLPLRGNSPISIAGVGYDIQAVTQPDAAQVIPLTLQNEDLENSDIGEEPLALVPGATLRLQTGVITDHNGYPVPDGTIVQFIQQDRIQGFFNVIAQIPTKDGIATFDYVLEARNGQFRIRVTAGEAMTSEAVDIAIGAEVSIVVVSPTPTLTPTPSATPTATPTPLPTFTSTPQPVATPEPPLDPQMLQLNISWEQLRMLAAMLSGLTFIMAIVLLIDQRQIAPTPSQRLRLLLLGLCGGLLCYNYFALELPSSDLLATWEAWAGLATTAVGGLLAIFIWYISHLFRSS